MNGTRGGSSGGMFAQKKLSAANYVRSLKTAISRAREHRGERDDDSVEHAERGKPPLAHRVFRRDSRSNSSRVSFHKHDTCARRVEMLKRVYNRYFQPVGLYHSHGTIELGRKKQSSQERRPPSHPREHRPAK